MITACEASNISNDPLKYALFISDYAVSRQLRTMPHHKHVSLQLAFDSEQWDIYKKMMQDFGYVLRESVCFAARQQSHFMTYVFTLSW